MVAGAEGQGVSLGGLVRVGGGRGGVLLFLGSVVVRPSLHEVCPDINRAWVRWGGRGGEG
jgi:hypothetical protein